MEYLSCPYVIKSWHRLLAYLSYFTLQQEVTHDVHYENYRSQKLASKGVSGAASAASVSSSTVSSSEESQSDKDRALREKEAELKRMQVRTVPFSYVIQGCPPC